MLSIVLLCHPGKITRIWQFVIRRCTKISLTHIPSLPDQTRIHWQEEIIEAILVHFSLFDHFSVLSLKALICFYL